MLPPDKDHPNIIAHPPLILAGWLAAGLLVHLLWPRAILPDTPARLLGGLTCLISGGLALWARKAMRRAGTNIAPDRPALSVVERGPYACTRNPMYLSLCLLQAGLSLLLNAAGLGLMLVPLGLTLHFGVVRREEEYLAGKFGQAYHDYRSRVRRWV